MDKREIIEKVKNERRVTIPALQEEFGVTFAQAAEILKELVMDYGFEYTEKRAFSIDEKLKSESGTMRFHSHIYGSIGAVNAKNADTCDPSKPIALRDYFSPCDTENGSVLDRAIKFAVEAHSGAFRKGTIIPYIVHPLEAAAIAATMTSDEEVIAAAVLHDTIEDTPTTKEQLILKFGNRIARLVCSDSEDKREHLPAAQTWAIRKQETLDCIPKATREEQIIILSDKLANIRSIYRDSVDIGDALWEKFNMKDKKKQGWYYCGIADRLDKVKGTHAYREYCELLDKIFK